MFNFGYFCFSAIDVKSQPNQFFRVKPSNADVAEGGTAIIACEVANRRGRVQWTKDGLTLGKFNQLNRSEVNDTLFDIILRIILD